MLYGGQPRPPANASGEHTVTTLGGKKIVITAERTVFTANVPDGTYKLSNGGEIRVKSGRVVWDGFGAVNRLKAGRWKGGYIDPVG